jgi:hypothetical protein
MALLKFQLENEARQGDVPNTAEYDLFSTKDNQKGKSLCTLSRSLELERISAEFRR